MTDWQNRMFYGCLAGRPHPQGARETFCFARVLILIHAFRAYTIYTHITHKCWGVILRENPSHTPWELKIVIPTYLYIFAYGFPQLLPLHFHTIERLIAQNTYHTLSKCQVRIWYCWEALEEAKDGKCNMDLVAGSGELDKTRFQVALLE